MHCLTNLRPPCYCALSRMKNSCSFTSAPALSQLSTKGKLSPHTQFLAVYKVPAPGSGDSSHRIASGSYDSLGLQVSDAISGERLHEFWGSGVRRRDAVIYATPEGQLPRIVSGDSDGQLRVYDGDEPYSLLRTIKVKDICS
jgi:hypothetical protein